MKMLLCLLCLSSYVWACSGNGGGYEIKAPVLPGYLKRLGLPVPMYNPRILDSFEKEPILEYDLSPASVEAMRVQYDVAKKAEEAGQNDLALKMYWDLAERGYGEANYRLACAFDEEGLGLSRSPSLFSFFLRRPCTVKEMILQQKHVRYCVDAEKRAFAEELAARETEAKESIARLASSPPGDGDVVDICLDAKEEETKLLAGAGSAGLRHRFFGK